MNHRRRITGVRAGRPRLAPPACPEGRGGIRSLAEYLVRRVLQSLLVLWLVTVVTFAIIHLAPGGPVQIFLQPGLSPAAIEQQIKNLGLDRPIPVQYLDWLGDLLRGDLGHTFKGYIRWPRSSGPPSKTP